MTKAISSHQHTHKSTSRSNWLMGRARKWMQIIATQLWGNYVKAEPNSGAIVFLYEVHTLPSAKPESMLTTLEGLMGGPEMARLESAGLHYCIINSVHLIGAMGSVRVRIFFFSFFLPFNSTILSHWTRGGTLKWIMSHKMPDLSG